MLKKHIQHLKGLERYFNGVDQILCHTKGGTTETSGTLNITDNVTDDPH